MTITTLAGTTSANILISAGDEDDIDSLTLTGFATIDDAGAITQDGTFVLGTTAADSAGLNIAAGASYSFLNDSDIYATGSPTIVNDGLLEKLGIQQYQESEIYPSFTNNSDGTIAAVTGEIALAGGGLLDGTLTGAGVIELGSNPNNPNQTYTIAAGAVINVATLAFGDALNLPAINPSNIVLAGGSFTFNDNLILFGASLLGGTMNIAGTAYAGFSIDDNATVIDSGTIIQIGGMVLGVNATSSGALIISAGAVYDDVGDAGYGISGDNANATFFNAGLYEFDDPALTGNITINFTNTGTIALLAGGIYQGSTLYNDGLVSIANGDYAAANIRPLANGGAIALGALGTADLAGTVAAQTINFTAPAAELQIGNLAAFSAEIENFAPGDTIDLQNKQINQAAFNPATDIVTLSDVNGGNTTAIGALTLAGFTDIAALALISDGQNGTDLVLNPPGGTFITPATLANDTWTAASGKFSSAANWSIGKPGPANTVILPTGQTGTITLNAKAEIFQLDDQTSAAFTLTQTAATLEILDGGQFNGSFLQSPGAVLQNDGGVLQLTGTANIGGTIAGTGTINLDNGRQDTLESGALFSIATLFVSDNLALDGSALITGNLIDTNGTIALNGQNLTLAGYDALTGARVAGPGTIDVTGYLHLQENMYGGAILNDAGTIVQTGPAYAAEQLVADTGPTALTIDPGAVYAFAGANALYANLVNNGLIEQLDPYGNDDPAIVGTLTNGSQGTIDAPIGAGINVESTGYFYGTLTGAGQIAITGNTQGTPSTIYSSAVITPGTFVLQGSDVMLGDQTIGGTVEIAAFLQGGGDADPSTLVMTGLSELAGLNLGSLIWNGMVLVDAGTMIDAGALQLGRGGDAYTALSITAGATFNIVDNFGIDTDTGNPMAIDNAGLFEQSAPAGTFVITPYFINEATATIDVLNGVIDLQNGGALAGVIEGPGELEGQGAFNIATLTIGGGALVESPAILVAGELVLENNATLAAPATLTGGGIVVSLGTIIGQSIGITGAGFAHNFGLISAQADGITLTAGAAYNYGLISAATGIVITSAAYTYNGGDITASGGDGIALTTGYAVNNTGYIQATGAGIYLGQTGLVENSGTAAGVIGVDLASGGTITNSGLIAGAYFGVYLGGNGTVTNTGTITGESYGIKFAEGSDSRLIISAASSIIGAISGGGGVLELAADGGTTGTFSTGMQSQFADFATVQIDAGAIWDFTGHFTFGADTALLNDGTIAESSNATLSIDTALTGTGSVELSKKPLTLNGSVASGEKISFTGTSEILALGDPKAFKGKIEKFAAGDTIDLTSIKLSAITSTHFAGGVLTLTEASGKLELTFASSASFGPEHFAIFKDGSGTGITLSSATAAQLSITNAYASTTLYAAPAASNGPVQGLLNIPVTASSVPPSITL